MNRQSVVKFLSDPALCLLDRDVLLYPYNIETNRIEFRLPAPSSGVWLRSRSNRPARSEMSADGRVLGFSVWSVTASDGQTTRRFEPPDLAGGEGFYEPELPRHIWTNGLARLPDGLLSGLRGPITISIEGGGLERYPADADAAMELQDLMRGVLSLGANCDIGFAQEHYDAEPIDLLRWANSSFEQLCFGLRNHFAGLGEAAHGELVWADTEYRLIDRRYASFHTMAFEPVDAAAQGKLLHDGLRRLTFLRRKLLHDLAEGRRLAVYRTRDPGFRAAEMNELHTALRKLGPSPLLVLTPAADGVVPGAVRVLHDGLFSATFDPDASGEPCFRATLELCRQACALRA